MCTHLSRPAMLQPSCWALGLSQRPGSTWRLSTSSVPRPRRAFRAAPVAQEKMHVPSDSFGGRSPERKAADALRNLFTFIAVKIILAQLEGSGRGGLASYDSRAYQDLMDFLEKHPITNGDEWVAKLMAHNEMLGVRVMEVRAAYAELDFEWDQCKRLATEGVKEANVRLMREFAAERFASSLASTGEAGDSTDAQGK